MTLDRDDKEYSEFELLQRSYNHYRKKLNYKYVKDFNYYNYYIYCFFFLIKLNNNKII